MGYLLRGVLFCVAFLFLTGEGSLSARQFAAPTPKHPPQLIIDDSIHPDFENLARETWDLFLKVFHSRSDCFGDVTLKASTNLKSRAGYVPDTATVIVHVPGTKAMLQSALVHEWAHHIEFQCDAHQELRSAFLKALGLPMDTLWQPHNITVDPPASDWALIPSEHYAEATVELVLGQRQIPTNIRVSREALQVLKDWVNDK